MKRDASFQRINYARRKCAYTELCILSEGTRWMIIKYIQEFKFLWIKWVKEALVDKIVLVWTRRVGDIHLYHCSFSKIWEKEIFDIKATQLLSSGMCRPNNSLFPRYLVFISIRDYIFYIICLSGELVNETCYENNTLSQK